MKCTGRNCPMQIGTVDPAHCLADECPYVTKPLTNADRMWAITTDEELAEFLENEIGDSVPTDWLDWLKQEVE